MKFGVFLCGKCAYLHTKIGGSDVREISSISDEAERLKRIFKAPGTMSIVRERQKELRAYTAAISTLACDNLAPVLRLPPSINTLHGDLKKLGDCARGNALRRKSKMNRIAKQICDRLEVIAPDQYLQTIDQDYNSVKIVSDAPVEWTPVRSLPLMLRYDVSRIPTTPGSLFFSQCICNAQLVLRPEHFSEILIIRSFDKNDPIRNVLSDAVMRFYGPEEKTSITTRLVDVETEDEFIDALNKFSGAMMIFDGHAHHSGNSEIGSLSIGGKQCDIWQLRGKMRVPPIVLLSACDTHPLDASHASTANGFIASGAKTVLATVLPVDAKYAALFIGRLLLRTAEFLPVIADEADRPIRWTRVISGMQRMTFITELRHALAADGKVKLSRENHSAIQMSANTWINSNDTEWYEKTCALICEAASIREEWLSEFIRTQFRIPDILKYVQIGNPELILIANKSMPSHVVQGLGRL